MNYSKLYWGCVGRIFLHLLTTSWLIVSAFPAYAQQGAVTLPRNLTDLSSMADRIIQGRVVAAKVEPMPAHPHLNTLVVTLEVADVLKGGSAKQVTFRQFIWDLRDVSNTAGYRLGDQVLLFLNRPTELGLSSPVGLEQGRFRIVKNGKGDSFAINGNGNSGLLNNVIDSGTLKTARLSASTRSAVRNFKEGAIPLQALKESVRVLLQDQARMK